VVLKLFPMVRKWSLLIVFLFLSAFSFWLMWNTFSYDTAKHQILISAKAWSDFGAYLPQIRSFSLGNNFPPEYPLFPGEPTRYHFLFYLFSGFLEKTGMRLDWAINLPSAIGLILLLLMMFLLSQKIFHKTSVSLLTVLFFLFNGSLSFLDFLDKYPLSSQSLNNLINLNSFVSFGPWNGSAISAFWNLNIYTNQRHLAFSFAVALTAIYLLYSGKRKMVYLTGFILGSFLLLNQAVFLITLGFVGWYFVIKSDLRKPLLVSLLGLLPWLLLSRLISISPSQISFYPGFLITESMTVVNIVKYWFLNIGLHLFLIPVGFVLAPKRARILIIPLLGLLIVPNLFRLSPDIINNHKFFNFFLILGYMFSSWTIYKIWQKGKMWKVISGVLVSFSILGGLVDILPVINDYYLPVSDIPVNADAKFFYENTSPDAVVLNSTWLYHPASIAGRKIFNGYPYFTWSFGYDQVSREKITASIYSGTNKQQVCKSLLDSHIGFVELSSHHEVFIKPNWPMWQKEFSPIYQNPVSGLKVYDILQNCRI
jgi:hypothetical protein